MIVADEVKDATWQETPDTYVKRPSINDYLRFRKVIITESLIVESLVVDATFTWDQAIPSSSWTITHNLGKFPSITVIDSSGNVVLGDYQYLSSNIIIATFNGTFSGKAYLN